MPTAHATVTTTRPGRYLTQLCHHVDQLSRHTGHRHRSRAGEPTHAPPGSEARATWSDATGVIDLGWGSCTLQATDGALVLHAEAHDPADLHRLQALLSARLQQIGRRDQLVVAWEPVTAPEPPPATDGPPDRAPDVTVPGRWTNRRRVVVLVAVGVLVVALHLGLGAAVFVAAPWAGRALDIVLAVIVVKLLASIVLGRRLVHHRLVHRRRRSAPTSQEAAQETAQERRA